MNKYKYLYLIWFLPAYLLFLCIQQTVVHYSLINTYKNGDSYIATVIDFDIKQIAAQTNGHIVLRFQPKNAPEITQNLSLPVEMASKVAKINVVPIRYRKGAFEDIVMMPAYRIQKDLIWTNLLMGIVGFLITLCVAVLIHGFVNKKLRYGDEILVIERLT